jgi:hypothetical protein
VFFSYATLYVYILGDGLESDYLAQRKMLKRLRKDVAQATDHATDRPAGGGPQDGTAQN